MRSAAPTISMVCSPGYTMWRISTSAGPEALRPHFHDEYLVCLQLQGKEQCQVTGETHSFTPGDLVFINPHQVHTGNSNAASDIEYLSLYIEPTVVEKYMAECGTSYQQPEFTQVKSTAASELANQLNNLWTHLEAGYPSTDQPGFQLEADGLIHRVVRHTFDDYSNINAPSTRSTSRVQHRKIARAIEYLRSLTTSECAGLTLDSVAKTAELSKFHFLREFKQAVGMTPGSYLRTLRLCQAARMIRNGRSPISEVASQVGFAEHPSFTRAFTKHMGMTPSAYQRLAIG